MPKTLSEHVRISSRFVRSIRLDADYGRTDVLESFVLQPSAAAALDIIARHINETQQRAFTWTGPYGGGKSSLALSLCSLVHPEQRIRGVARKVLAAERGSALTRAFECTATGGWTVLPVVGKRAIVEDEIGVALDAIARRKHSASGKRNVVAELVRIAENQHSKGVLLIIDELGKFLEHAAMESQDVYFFQELAEAAARTKGKLVVIGVLHQSFDQYAARLGRDARDEWAKIQGRFVDISLAAASDEQIDLIGKAISSEGVRHTESSSICATVARCIAQRRSISAKHLDSSLDRSWPLHPVTAALLGPSSRRRFSQNERSIFGFLNSVEPFGFREFLDSTVVQKFCFYYPWQFWDYLRANFSPGILASADGHRWALGLEAVERAEARGCSLDVGLVKTVALVEMFKAGSGIAAELVVLESCFPAHSQADISAALRRLASWSILIFRKHLAAWGIYAGSDFDIDAALSKARAEANTSDVYRLTKSIELAPVLAKRVYQQTGAMHFLTRNILTLNEATEYTRKYRPSPGSCGEFLLILPNQGESPQQAFNAARTLSGGDTGSELLIGVPDRGAHISESAAELFALEHVYTSSPELDSDRVAAREISARIDALREELDDLLQDAFVAATWYARGKKVSTGRVQSLASIASSVVSNVYSSAPVLLSELINREYPSSNSVKARRDLMYRMLANAGEEKLGYTGFSADAGLYFTVLNATTLHRKQNGVWGFFPPTSEGRGASLKQFWRETGKAVLTKREVTSLTKLYNLWAAKPFGVKSGVSPVLALAYYLANRKSLAVYHDGVFVPELTPLHIDEWLQDASRVEWRYIHISDAENMSLSALGDFLSEILGRKVAADPLEVSRALVSLVLQLPGWTRRTSALSERAKNVRQILLKANDPHRVLFVDLAAAMGATPDFSSSLIHCLLELAGAFGKLLADVEGKLFEALKHDFDIKNLNMRAKVVAGISGDFRLDAFATRLGSYVSRDSDLEAIISLAVNKPSRDWTDRDIEAAVLQLGEWSLAFRRVEALAPLRNRPATRHALAVVFGPADGSTTFSRIIEVSSAERKRVSQIAQELLATEAARNGSREIFLAALAEAGASLVAELSEEE